MEAEKNRYDSANKKTILKNLSSTKKNFHRNIRESTYVYYVGSESCLKFKQ